MSRFTRIAIAQTAAVGLLTGLFAGLFDGYLTANIGRSMMGPNVSYGPVAGWVAPAILGTVLAGGILYVFMPLATGAARIRAREHSLLTAAALLVSLGILPSALVLIMVFKSIFAFTAPFVALGGLYMVLRYVDWPLLDDVKPMFLNVVLAAVFIGVGAVGTVAAGPANAGDRLVSIDVDSGGRIQMLPDVGLNQGMCYTNMGNGGTGVFIIDLGNEGGRPLDLAPARIRVRESDGTINKTLSRQAISLAPPDINAKEAGIAILRTGGSSDWPAPNSYAVYQVNASQGYRLKSDASYQVRLRFHDMDQQVRFTCTASRPE